MITLRRQNTQMGGIELGFLHFCLELPQMGVQCFDFQKWDVKSLI